MVQNDYPDLEEFLYRAIYIPQGEKLPGRDIILQPEIYVYIDGFGGGRHDSGFVAEADGRAVGAVWVRLLNGKPKGFGNIDDETPEFAISVLPNWRGMGIGTALMKAMLEKLRADGYKKASLSVNKENYARSMYEKSGFETTAVREDDVLMVCHLCAGSNERKA